MSVGAREITAIFGTTIFGTTSSDYTIQSFVIIPVYNFIQFFVVTTVTVTIARDRNKF